MPQPHTILAGNYAKHTTNHALVSQFGAQLNNIAPKSDDHHNLTKAFTHNIPLTQTKIPRAHHQSSK